jgi:molybdopterin-guanine dinucleotide biosynthesis protein A
MVTAIPKIACAIILAGGRSTRMGSDKKMLRINGEPLIERLYRFLVSRFNGIIVSTGTGERNPLPGALQVEDEEPDKGPLMAICSCLKRSPARVNFVIACDIPEVNMTLVRRLLSFANDYDAVVPSFSAGLVEPLFAVYSRDMVPLMERQLAEDRLRPSDCFPLCSTKIISIADTGWYRNINTPAEFSAYAGLDKVRAA